MELLGGTERICPICGKEFWARPEHVYKRTRWGITVYLCSWHCLNEWDAGHKPKPTHKAICERKDEIIEMVNKGMNSVQIGKVLGVAPQTVRYHIVKLQMKGELPS